VVDSGGEDQAMSEIATPKNILEDILRELSYRPFVNSWQRPFMKVALWTLALLIVAVIGTIIAFQVWGIKSPDIVIRGLLITILGVIFSPFAVIVPKLFRYFRHRERAELEPVLDSFDKELAIISHLASTYDLSLRWLDIQINKSS
jgi:hypothetical protein